MDLAGVFARTLLVDNGAVGAHFGALAALYTLGFVNVGVKVLVKGDGAYPASVLTAVGNAATAGVADIVAGHGALVAGNVDHFNDIGVVFIAAHGQLDALFHNGPLFVDAAAHGGFLLDDQLGDFRIGVQQTVLKGITGNLTKNLIFQVLYLGIKFSVFHGNCGHMFS